MSVIKLQSSDGVIFEVNLEAAHRSSTLPTKNHLGVRQLIPLPEVNSEILEKVIAWANYYNDLRISERNSHAPSRWARDFLKQDRKTLRLLVLAANCLGMKTLQECAIYIFFLKRRNEQASVLLTEEEQVDTGTGSDPSSSFCRCC